MSKHTDDLNEFDEPIEDTSALDLNFNDVYDFETFTDNEEVQLRVVKATREEKKKSPGEFQLVMRLEDPSDPKKEDIFLYLGIPTEDERRNDPKKANKKMLRILDFYEAFDIDYSRPVILRDIEGATGYCIMGIQKATAEFPERSTIRSFVKRQ